MLEIQKVDDLEEQVELYIQCKNRRNDAKEDIKDANFRNKQKYCRNTRVIEKNLKADWKIDRISKIDLSLLKLAIYEIKY